MPLSDFPLLRVWLVIIGSILEIVGVLLASCVAAYKFISNSKLPRANVHKTQSEAGLNEAKAHSIEFNDQLKGIEMMQSMIRQGLALEQLLTEKNEIIADREDEIFTLQGIVEQQAAELKAYENQKLLILGRKRLNQAEGILVVPEDEKTGSD